MFPPVVKNIHVINTIINYLLASPMSPLWPSMGLNGENIVISASFILILRSWRSTHTCQDQDGLQFNQSYSCNEFFKYCTLYRSVWYISHIHLPTKKKNKLLCYFCGYSGGQQNSKYIKSAYKASGTSGWYWGIKGYMFINDLHVYYTCTIMVLI